MYRVSKEYPVIAWWSGGITSAVACRIAIELFGTENVRVVMIDTHNEDPDTYRFKKDCESWYQKPIESISAIGKKWDNIEDVWTHHLSLNTARGAICSSELKREVRKDFQRKNKFSFQVFGFEFIKKEFNRAYNLKKNYLSSNPIFPLLMMGLSKTDCIKIVQEAGIKVPDAYSLGLPNNNCLGTGCVQGGIGYWKKLRDIKPDLYERMADLEWSLTSEKGSPVTICKDQSNSAKESGIQLVFLRKNPDYPDHKCIDDIPTKEIESFAECNGFCGTGKSLKSLF